MSLARRASLLVLLAAVCTAAPKLNTGEADSEPNWPLIRVQRSGTASPYWWIPGSRGTTLTFSHISCGDPNRPRHGSSLFESVQAGAIVIHSCNPGYKLVGAKLRLCQSNGRWTPELPQCVFIDCGDPGTPIYGSRWSGSTSLNSIVTYMCNPGFNLVGNSFRMCQSSGRWSGALPICQPAHCPKLRAPKGGSVSVRQTAVGRSTATYSCVRGFRLFGNPIRTCGRNGAWLGKPPICRAISCEPLSNPENGRVSAMNTTFNSLAFYTCNHGYRREGRPSRTCQLSGTWSGVAPRCQAISCSVLPDIVNGRVITTSTAVGSTAHYICNPGLVVDGDETRTCQRNGEWSGQEPTCKRVDCRQLSAPDNGLVRFSSTTPGSTATYSCNTGFTLVGLSQRICQIDGTWTGSKPLCQRVDCRQLSAPDNGLVRFSSTTPGSTATYSCNTGFTLVGLSQRICQIDGTWTGSKPLCQRVDCRQLSAPDNGLVRFSSTTPGSTATYSCNTGFTLVGLSQRICQIDGTWTRSKPLCQRVDCGQLSAPDNGLVHFSSTTPGSTATYSCNTGFTLVGLSQRICQIDGTWTGSKPLCQRVDCRQLSAPDNGLVRFSSTTPGSTATYSCNTGFTLVGLSQRICQIDGTWTGSKPLCQRVDCRQLSAPDNGLVRFSSTTPGSTATYSCNTGFTLVGLSQRICQIDGTWTRSKPLCQRLSCSPLVAPSNGRVSLTGTGVGAVATYSCLHGYTLVGKATRTCEATERWSGNAPFCRGVMCPVLEAPENGRIISTSRNVGARVTYSCLPGFELQGVKQRTCLSNGEWAYEQPSCIAISCPDLPSPSNGQVVLRGSTLSSTAIYSCNRGFILVGSNTRVCQVDGTWSGEAPTCNTVGCSDLEPPKDALLHFTGAGFGAVVQYRCIPGFQLRGNVNRTCLQNGQWSGTEPVCNRINCNLLTPPKNGDISFSAGTHFGSVATHSCESPFLLEGNPIRVCMANGQWSGSAPRCESFECPALDAPENGAVNVSGLIVTSAATYYCKKGFTLVGSAIRVCQNNGFWAGVTPRCQPMDCGTLKPPDNGDIQLTGTVIASSATYSCNEGFNLKGVKVRVCQESGEWSGEAPICSPVRCSPLSGPENGVVELTGTAVGDTATYSCRQGFILFGKGIRTCQASGTWNGKSPDCRVVDCGPLEAPNNGNVMTSGTTFGLTANYVCNPGFEMLGVASRVCQITGKWSGENPTCIPMNCANLSNPLNGDIVVTGLTVGDTATYSCNNGFLLQGVNRRVCTTGREWSGSAPTCQAIQFSCGHLAVPDSGQFVLSNGTYIGSIATYSCNKGYSLVGFETRICQADRTWSGLAPTCEIVDCGDLRNPPNGRIILPGTTFGSVAVYSCLSGFTFGSNGVKTRTCQANGMWSGETPTCNPVEPFHCARLLPPANGGVVHRGTTVGSIAAYTCNQGYMLQGGNEFRQCRERTGWTGSAPTCKGVDCGSLTPPINGHLMVAETTFDSIATYSCLAGYLLIGPVIRTCLVIGEWSGETPKCYPVECGSLPNPLNGRVSLTGIEFGSVANYTCNEGYTLQHGDARRRCGPEGEWSGTEPTCRKTSCGDPGTPENGLRVGNDWTIGAIVYYQCNATYELVGLESRTCQNDGTWSGSLPACLRLSECSNEGNTVKDACGRRCTCRNGKLVDCCRVRVDFASLTVNQRRSYIGTVLRAATDPNFIQKYETLIFKYKSSFDTLAQETRSNVSMFFPWHRYFLLEYENLLREIDCHITIPYWDWTALPMNPYMSSVWSPESGFGDSSRSNDSCVNNGPFNSDVFNVTPSAGGGCLERHYRMQLFPTRAIVEQDLLTHLPSQFNEFHQFLQVFIHTNVRCFVGGQMCSKDAANDPAYLLHLSQLDFLFTRWQEISAAHLNVQFVNDNRRLPLTAVHANVSQFSNNKNLPNGVKVCYAPTEFESHVPPSMLFLADALKAVTDNHNLHMQCIGDSDMQGASMSKDAEDVMHKMCGSETGSADGSS